MANWNPTLKYLEKKNNRINQELIAILETQSAKCEHKNLKPYMEGFECQDCGKTFKGDLK